MKVGQSENSGFVHETTFVHLYQVLISAVNIQYTLYTHYKSKGQTDRSVLLVNIITVFTLSIGTDMPE